MKKMITSAGLVVVSAASLQAQSSYTPAPELSSTQTTKPWSVSATVRGFYDDNYATRPKPFDRESWGVEISPSLGLNFTLPQTYIGLSYVYGLRWYEGRAKEDPSADHSHQVNAKLSHAFSERYKLDLSDSFVVAQEPDLIDPDIKTLPLRSDGDNIRNTASATFTADLTELFGLTVGYSNSLYDYDDPGYSASLDRMEHLAIFNTRWQILPTTVGIVGYQLGFVDYTSDAVLLTYIDPAGNLRNVGADARNRTSHYVYVGADHSFNPQLNASARVGAQINQYDDEKLPPGGDDSTINPYVDLNLTWTYLQGSYVQLGARHSRTATDQLGTAFGSNSLTLDQEATSLYGSINHRITGKLVASALGSYQHGSFEGGTIDGQNEDFFQAGINLTYEINKFLSAETGYNYDKLNSDVGRSYTRNRVYVGLRATY